MNRVEEPVDSRYVHRFADEGEMSAILDLEDLDEVETFFMFLWNRPLSLSSDFGGDEVHWLRFDFFAKHGRTAPADVTFPVSLRDILNDPSIVATIGDLGSYDTDAQPTYLGSGRGASRRRGTEDQDHARLPRSRTAVQRNGWEGPDA